MAYHILVFFQKLIRKLPMRTALFLGRLLGFSFYCIPKKRINGFRNIKLAFPRKTTYEALSILRRSFMNFGMSVMESFMIKEALDAGAVMIPDFPRQKDAHIIVGIHNGSWELYNAQCRRRRPFAVMVNPQKNKGLDSFLNEQRRRNHILVCTTIKQLVKCIRQEYWIGLVMDHGAEDNAPLVEFFGCQVPTPQGAVYLAKKFHKKIYPAFGHRLPDKKHIVQIGKPIDPEGFPVEGSLREINRAYEEFLEVHPDHFMWWFKRFKRKRSLEVLILSDGKAGHVRQSMTFLNFMQELDYEIKTRVIEIPPVSRVSRFFLELAAFVSTRPWIGHMEVLRYFIKPHVYEQLEATFADVVVSTGTLLAPVNVLVSNALGARSVTILKPNLPVNKFSLAVVPEHDRLLSSRVVSVKGVLSYPHRAVQDKEEFLSRFSVTSRKKLALFIGGPIEDNDIFYKHLRLFLKKITEFCLATDRGLLVTSSRRTPQFCTQLIERQLSHFPNTEKLIIAHKRNYPFIPGAFLALSDTVCVTSDSISMVTESLSMKRITVCVELEAILSTHHVNFYASVDGLVNFLKYPYAVGTLKPPPYSVRDYNKQKIMDAIRRLL